MKEPINVSPSTESVAAYMAAVDGALKSLERLTRRTLAARVSQNERLDLRWLVGRLDQASAELRVIADALVDAKIGLLPPELLAKFLGGDLGGDDDAKNQN